MSVRVLEDDLQQWIRSLNECRIQSLQILAVVQIVLSWLLIVPHIVAVPDLGWTIVALFFGAVGAWLLVRRSYRLGAAVLVVSELIASFTAIRATGATLAEWSGAIVVSTATVLLGAEWAIFLATVVTVGLLRNVGGPTPWTDTFALQGIAMTWVLAFLTWLALRPLKQSLEWAMNSHLDARTRAEEAERHRGELGRTVKSLTETHERLERLTAELDRARLAAENARALKAKFAAYISHELRTPLNLIIGFSEMMVLAPHTYGDAVLPPAYRGDINAIYQSARHLATLINDVLDLSQIDAHRMALDRDDVQIADVITEAANTVEAAYAEKGLRLRVVIQESLPILYIDRTRIRQVLLNLLGNALRFTETGSVTISAILERRDVVVSVTDTGIGIPEHELSRLFDDFRQVERSEQERGEGSGLGLAIARRFVGLHGGWIRAESQVGRGTTMTFGLPAGHIFVETSLASADEGDQAKVPPANLPLVAVDASDPWLLRATQRYLDGFRIVATNPDGLASDQRLRRSGVGAVIVSAPSDPRGWERLDELTRSSGGVPVVCCSLRGGREAISRLGVADYIDKPVTRQRLAQVLGRWRPRQGFRSILVVDDDHNMVRLLTRMIYSISRRYRVAKAYDGAMALELMRESRPDLVLMDLLMPGIDGYEMLQRMRSDETLSDLPVVVVTARGTDDDAVVAGMFGLARSGGFPAGELMRCLQATLDNLNAQSPDVSELATVGAPPG